MKSEVEKLKLPKAPKGNFCLGYQDEEGVKLQMWELAEKANEIIDRLNEPEEKREKKTLKELEDDYISKLKQQTI